MRDTVDGINEKAWERAMIKPVSVRRKVVFEHDPEPDFSWLEQDQYNPHKPKYDPIYRSVADMRAKRNPYDGDWYRDVDNHVALTMIVYELSDTSDDWEIVDSLCNIDFLRDGNDWQTGTFYRLSALKSSPYLQELAKDAGLT